MIRKFWLALVGVMMAFSASAAQFTEGQQYTKLNEPVSDLPQVVEFFSFYCSHCYQFNMVYHVTDGVSKALPDTVNITKYHVDFLGPLGKELTKAWAVAISLGVEDKIMPPIFNAIHQTRTLNTVNDIRNIFISAGVSAEDYDQAMNGFTVNSLVLQQQQAAEKVNLRGVPAMFVNGTYQVNNSGISADSPETYVKEYGRVVNYLLTLK